MTPWYLTCGRAGPTSEEGVSQWMGSGALAQCGYSRWEFGICLWILIARIRAQTSYSVHSWGLCDVQEKEGRTFPVEEDAPGAFGLAVTNPAGKLRAGCCGGPSCHAVGWQGSSGADRPPNPIWRRTCLGISRLQGVSMWAWNKSCMFWAGSPQSHLMLCLTPKSHGTASFIPHHFYLSQGLAEQ